MYKKRPSFSSFGTWLIAVAALWVAGCASLPPGADFPKPASTAVADPGNSRLGRQFAAAIRSHPGQSGFRLLTVGLDSFLLRVQSADAAERTLDVQYFVIQNDDTGQLMQDAILRAADRGVRVRVLIDDFSQFGTNAPVTALAAHPKVELRLFNPFAYRGTVRLIRDAEMIVDAARLNYRMHNKVFVVDNAMAIVGGRNIGDEYFQAATAYEFGDFDVVAVGPAVQEVSASFDAFWNSPLSIPVQALADGRVQASDLEQLRAALAAHRETVASAPQVTKLALGEPFSSLVAGRTPFVWARGEVMYDSPEKAKIANGEQPGRLLHKQLRTVASEVRSELVVVSPYLVPGENGMRYFGKLREKDVKVRLLTNSLACTDMPIAHSGYRPYRIPMLEMGVELYEVKPQLGQPEVRGGSLKSPSSGQYTLHAKVFVFDRRQVFIGSMNLDPRSLHLNTEIGVLIDSPELARQVIARFDDIAQPPNSYVMMLDKADAIRGPALVWRTEERGASVEYRDEPDTTFWLKTKVDMLSLLTLEDLL